MFRVRLVRSLTVLSLGVSACSADASVRIPSFQQWLGAQRQEFMSLSQRFGVGIRFDGYAEWLSDQRRQRLEAGPLPSQNRAGEEAIDKILRGDAFPSLETHWGIAEALIVDPLEAAFVMAATQYASSFPCTDLFANDSPRFRRLREKQKQVDAKLGAMFKVPTPFATDPYPVYDWEAEISYRFPFAEWVMQGIAKRGDVVAETARLAGILGVAEEALSKMLDGDSGVAESVVVSSSTALGIALEFGEPIHLPFVLLAYEREVLGRRGR